MITDAQHYYLSAIIVAIADLVLLCFVYFKSANKRLAKRFAVYAYTIAHWSFFVFLCTTTRNHDLSYFLCIVCHIGGIFGPVAFLHFVISYTGNRSKIIGYILKTFYYLTITESIIIILSPQLFIADVVPKLSFTYFPNPGPMFHLWIVQFVLMLLTSFIVLIIEFVKRVGLEKKAMFSFIVGNLIGYLGLTGCFFPVYNITYFPFPFGIWGAFLFICVTAFAAMRYKLLDIEVIIRRTAVFAGLFAFVYGVFTVVTVIGQEFFKSTLGWNEWMALIPTVLIITFALRPLESFLTNTTERFLFQKKYDYRELLKTFTNEILTVLDLQKLMDQTIAGLTKIIKLESACVLLYDKEASLYKTVAGYGLKDEKISFKKEDTIITYLKASQQHILMDKSVDKIEGDGHLKEDFKRLNAKLCLPIELHDDLIGILALGMKKSGEDYTQEDIDILTTLARTEAIAISNAQLFDELSKTQAEAAQREKMAVIGTLAAGINHEICNPLGIVRGHCEMFLLNSRDGFYKEKSREDILNISSEIMSKVIKETDRATSITKKLSSFAKPARQSEFEEVTIEKEVVEVLGLIEHDLQINNIDIQRDFPNNFPPILADRKQIQQIFFNIIRNAAQAIDGKRGRILVSGFSDNGSAVVRISDNGMGIPQEKIGQIFNPFYTTKAPGKGTGLGLFIVKQVVERNKGTIALESQEGVGTTFTLRFPVSSGSLALHH